MQPMNIAVATLNQFSPSLDGGSNSIMDLLTLLARHGANTYLFNFITCDYAEPYTGLVQNHPRLQAMRQNYDGSVLTVSGFYFNQKVLPFTLSEVVRRSGLVVRTMEQLFSEHKIDYLFTCDDAFPLLLNAFLIGIRGGHIFNSVANVESLGQTGPIRLRILEKRQVFVVSQFLQEKVRSVLHLDSEVWNPAIDLIAYRVERCGRERSFGFCAAGKLGYKGDEVAREVALQTRRGKLMVVGDTSLFDHAPGPWTSMQRLVDMRPFYAAIDLLIVPSLVEEAFSRVVIEAAANGIPAIARSVGGIPEALDGSGVLISLDPAGQAEGRSLATEMAALVDDLLGDAMQYREMRSRANNCADRFQARQDEAFSQFLDRFGQ